MPSTNERHFFNKLSPMFNLSLATRLEHGIQSNETRNRYPFFYLITLGDIVTFKKLILQDIKLKKWWFPKS